MQTLGFQREDLSWKSQHASLQLQMVHEKLAMVEEGTRQMEA